MLRGQGRSSSLGRGLVGRVCGIENWGAAHPAVRSGRRSAVERMRLSATSWTSSGMGAVMMLPEEVSLIAPPLRAHGAEGIFLVVS
ncbi:hypothetical protein ASE36_20520 [Rhizobium sp. Root274]|nr:hypothetical protein ASE36_20520 [Rhizobium sp. Root274]